jgi:uncharacterized protein (TIGR03437 family)
VWHKGTVRLKTLSRAVLVFTLGAMAAFAQTATDWRKVGGSAVDLALAAPATGPVESVWFSPGGSALLARTQSGKIFQTADYETWTLAQAPSEPPALVPAAAARIPDSGARVVFAPGNRARIYALGRQLFRSDDGGRTWENLTAYRSNPIVGSGQHSLAISPVDPDHLVVSNDFGVWRSMDGGLSWNGLNQFLPNLTVRRILGTPSGTSGTRVAADGLGALELPPGGTVWQPAAEMTVDPDAALRQRFSGTLGTTVSAAGIAGRHAYAGTLDGRTFLSVDGGATFTRIPMPAGATGPVERILVDASDSGMALAVLGGHGPRILRTITGNFWDVLDGNLPDAGVHAVAADRSAGAVYVATDRGVFYGRVDLLNASQPAVGWTNLTAKLPDAVATDVRLDAAGVQLYIALDGYGVYAAAAPHRARNLRIVNAGDFTTRAAAPGSLLTVVGGKVDSANAGGLSYPVLAGNDQATQIQVPFEATGPNVLLALRTADGTITRDLPVLPVSPAIMVSSDGAPMLWDADTGLPVDFRNVAHSNGRLQIWATGLGRVRPDWPTGMQAPAENTPTVVAPIRAFLDRTPLQVTRATLVPGYIGFYLIEVQLPPIVNAGTSELLITADAQESNRVPLTIEP